MNVEEGLREMREKAALLRYVADVASESRQLPDPDVFAGVGDVCACIEQIAPRVHRALTAEQLGIELGRPRAADVIRILR